MILKNKIKGWGLLVTACIISCDGTLGGFNTISFPKSKKNIENAIDTLYSNYPDYRIPDKYKDFDNWSKSGYDFLDTRIFYFSQAPEEMYYVSFVGDEEAFKDSTHIDIAIRAVFVGNKKKWFKQEDFSKEEESRIQARFNSEIISKLERYTKSKAKDLGY
ncbi:hypothetical protein [Flavobacterium sp. ENC]|uniref:hypothetical protein n=1 Tax=Flavobacterium sp. ENC TaxID=2897330 RepID=UPI001E644D1C|nr:hypothetical protein [Flavobacterium sp. ENC]MCD0464980.1 hypothetical protein [Flavobacterium sp. ENC]